MWTLAPLSVALMLQNCVHTTSVGITDNNFVELKSTTNAQKAEEITKVQKQSDGMDFETFEEFFNFRNKYFDTFENKDIRADRRLHRSRRSDYMSDHGYGSRLQAGSNIAQDVSAIHDIFGKYGVGKRNKNTLSERDNYFRNSFTRRDVNKDNGNEFRRAVVNAFLLGTKFAKHQNPIGTDDFTRSLLGDLDSNQMVNLKSADTYAKRSTTDYGYGSRIAAGNKLANSIWTKDSLYGSDGPGKRSSGYSPSYTMGDLESEDTYEKRSLTDYGYGSRIEAGIKLANSLWTKDSLYGAGGPGKRSNNDVNTRKGYEPETENIFQKRYLTDFGYGSRVAAANRVANSLRTKENLYGSGGPGKRSIPLENEMLDPDIDLSEIDDETFPQHDTVNLSVRSTLDLLMEMTNLLRTLKDRFGYDDSLSERNSFNSEDTFSRSLREGNEDISDKGYGSRVHVGKHIAHDNLSTKDLFGMSGPERKRRNEVVDSEYFEEGDSL